MLERHLYIRTSTSKCTYWRNKGHTGAVLVSMCFFFFVSQGQDCCETSAPAPEGRGAKCAHLPMWKSAFSRILPEGMT